MVCPCRHTQADENGKRPQHYGIGPRHQIPPALPLLIMPPPRPLPPLCCFCCGRGRASFCARKRTPPESPPDPRRFCFVACFAASAMFRERARARERASERASERWAHGGYACHYFARHFFLMPRPTRSPCCSPPEANSPGTLRRTFAPLQHL